MPSAEFDRQTMHELAMTGKSQRTVRGYRIDLEQFMGFLLGLRQRRALSYQ
jgi:hypothetical protein